MRVDNKLLKSVSEVMKLYDLEINLDTKLDDLDSLDKVQIIINLEEEFNILIEDDFAIDFEPKTVRDLKVMLKEKYGISEVRDERKDKINKLNESNLPN